jgi:isopenicillin-N N-acyltransferase-like protein
MQIEPFPLIEISGAPRQRGRQYGEQAAERIRKGIAMYTGLLGGLKLGEAAIAELVRRFVPTIDAFDPAYVEEMRGIAEGAKTPFEDIVLLNARTEVVRLARRGKVEREPDGCTGAVILPEASRDGIVIHGQNWDWREECVETAVVLKIHRDDGPDVLTFTEAGGLARSGFNSAGIAITANYLESDRDRDQSGVPLPLIRRKALECTHLALAIRAIAGTAKSASNNMMLSDAAGVAIDFECAPDEVFPLYPDRGVLVHANHWIGPVALSKLRDTGIADNPDSLYRDLRVRRALEKSIGALTRDHLREALFDDFGTPYSVCRPPRPAFKGNIAASVAMVLMEPARGLMEVIPMPALNRKATLYHLDTAPSAARSVA